MIKKQYTMIRITRPQHDALKKIKTKTGLPMNDIVERALLLFSAQIEKSGTIPVK